MFLQKKGEVMNEVFTKVVKLCFEAKVSRWEHRVSNFGSSIDSALCNDQGGACVSKKQYRVSCACFYQRKKCEWKRGVVPKKEQKLGSRIMKTKFMFENFLMT